MPRSWREPCTRTFEYGRCSATGDSQMQIVSPEPALGQTVTFCSCQPGTDATLGPSVRMVAVCRRANSANSRFSSSCSRNSRANRYAGVRSRAIPASNTNRERRSAGDRVGKGHIAGSTDSVQPDTYFCLGIMDSNRALLWLVQFAQKNSLDRQSNAMLYSHGVPFCGFTHSNSRTTQSAIRRNRGRSPIRRSMPANPLIMRGKCCIRFSV